MYFKEALLLNSFSNNNLETFLDLRYFEFFFRRKTQNIASSEPFALYLYIINFLFWFSQAGVFH